MSAFAHLLAKSTATPHQPKQQEKLDGHILGVLAAARTLLQTVGRQSLESLALSSACFDVLELAVTRGALLHDLGKANDQFQRMVRDYKSAQALRHEWISLDILLQCSELDRWLFVGTNELVRHASICAAVGHHLKAADVRDGTGQARIRVLAGHSDIAQLLQRSKLGEAPPIVSDYDIDLTDSPRERITSWKLDADLWWRELSPETKRVVALIKALVIAADLAASALPRRGIDCDSWIRSVLGHACTTIELTGLAERSLAGSPPRPFQDKVAASSADVTLVSAGCGSGKTTAAYLWAARRANGRKLFFCYPTTGTATEGYAGYVFPDDIPSALIHSRAEVDLQDIVVTPEDDDRELRSEVLAAWDVPLVVCTADTVLGLVQNNKAGLFALPAIAHGAFVFDEVHAYDDRMFGALLRFIGAFRGSPLLLMTASLQAHRLDAVRRLCADSGQVFATSKDSQSSKQFLDTALLVRHSKAHGARSPVPWQEATACYGWSIQLMRLWSCIIELESGVTGRSSRTMLAFAMPTGCASTRRSFMHLKKATEDRSSLLRRRCARSRWTFRPTY